MTPEFRCAQILHSLEGEQFLAVGEDVARRLNPKYDDDRRAGVAQKFPDLLSTKRHGRENRYRLREVKFKLEEELVRKAMEQLKSGARRLDEKAKVDRLEIVVPLQSRIVKADEKRFLGKSLGENRYRLRLNKPVTVQVRGKRYPVTVLFL